MPSAKGLTRFDLNQGFHAITLKLNDDVNDGQRLLMPVLTYADVRFPIRLQDSSQIKFSIQQDSTNPAIGLDSNGLVHAIHAGAATITGDFAGIKIEMHLTVESEP